MGVKNTILFMILETEKGIVIKLVLGAVNPFYEM
jgi:hypothetical protein